MPALYTPTPAEAAEWEAWVAARPADIREVAERLNPWTLYRLKTTGQYVTVLSYQEADPDGDPMFHNVTLNINVDARWNFAAFPGRRVFGVDPDDLEETDEMPEEQHFGPIVFHEIEVSDG
jgi:hypothetical protein